MSFFRLTRLRVYTGEQRHSEMNESIVITTDGGSGEITHLALHVTGNCLRGRNGCWFYAAFAGRNIRSDEKEKIAPRKCPCRA